MTLRIQGAVKKKVVPARRHERRDYRVEGRDGIKGRARAGPGAGDCRRQRVTLWKDKVQKPRI